MIESELHQDHLFVPRAQDEVLRCYFCKQPRWWHRGPTRPNLGLTTAKETYNRKDKKGATAQRSLDSRHDP